MKEKVLAYGKKRIDCDALWKMKRFVEYKDFVSAVAELVSEGVLTPVKASGTNGRSPALYNRYHILDEEIDYCGELLFVRKLYPGLNMEGYRKHPEMVRADHMDLKRLSDFLWEHEEELDLPMSVNERSFAIFGREKAIKEERRVKAILKFNGLDDKALRIYRTPEPLFDFVCRETVESKVLILENKDPWFTLRKLAREQGLAGWLDFDVLLYGEGKKITDRMGRLTDYDQWVLGGTNQYFYFGDLDWEGIAIYLNLRRKNPNLTISLCRDLYKAMLEAAKGVSLPEMKAGQKKCEADEFLMAFSPREQKMMMDILESGRYIPQEIIGYPWFLACVEGAE